MKDLLNFIHLYFIHSAAKTWTNISLTRTNYRLLHFGNVHHRPSSSNTVYLTLTHSPRSTAVYHITAVVIVLILSILHQAKTDILIPTSCPTGYLLPDCSRLCPPTFYGINCSSACPATCLNSTCFATSGNCYRCRAGFRGPKCSITCLAGLFGEDCLHMCPRQCLDETCNPFSGYCLRCKDGYRGKRCDLLVSKSDGDIVGISGRNRLGSNNSTWIGGIIEKKNDESDSTGDDMLIISCIVLAVVMLPFCVGIAAYPQFKKRLREKQRKAKEKQKEIRTRRQIYKFLDHGSKPTGLNDSIPGRLPQAAPRGKSTTWREKRMNIFKQRRESLKNHQKGDGFSHIVDYMDFGSSRKHTLKNPNNALTNQTKSRNFSTSKANKGTSLKNRPLPRQIVLSSSQNSVGSCFYNSTPTTFSDNMSTVDVEPSFAVSDMNSYISGSLSKSIMSITSHQDLYFKTTPRVTDSILPSKVISSNSDLSEVNIEKNEGEGDDKSEVSIESTTSVSIDSVDDGRNGDNSLNEMESEEHDSTETSKSKGKAQHHESINSALEESDTETTSDESSSSSSKQILVSNALENDKSCDPTFSMVDGLSIFGNEDRKEDKSLGSNASQTPWETTLAMRRVAAIDSSYLPVYQPTTMAIDGKECEFETLQRIHTPYVILPSFHITSGVAKLVNAIFGYVQRESKQASDQNVFESMVADSRSNLEETNERIDLVNEERHDSVRRYRQGYRRYNSSSSFVDTEFEDGYFGQMRILTHSRNDGRDEMYEKEANSEIAHRRNSCSHEIETKPNNHASHTKFTFPQPELRAEVVTADSVSCDGNFTNELHCKEDGNMTLTSTMNSNRSFTPRRDNRTTISQSTTLMHYDNLIQPTHHGDDVVNERRSLNSFQHSTPLVNGVYELCSHDTRQVMQMVDASSNEEASTSANSLTFYPTPPMAHEVSVNANTRTLTQRQCMTGGDGHNQNPFDHQDNISIGTNIVHNDSDNLTRVNVADIEGDITKTGERSMSPDKATTWKAVGGRTTRFIGTSPERKSIRCYNGSLSRLHSCVDDHRSHRLQSFTSDRHDIVKSDTGTTVYERCQSSQLVDGGHDCEQVAAFSQSLQNTLKEGRNTGLNRCCSLSIPSLVKLSPIQNISHPENEATTLSLMNSLTHSQPTLSPPSTAIDEEMNSQDTITAMDAEMNSYEAITDTLLFKDIYLSTVDVSSGVSLDDQHDTISKSNPEQKITYQSPQLHDESISNAEDACSALTSLYVNCNQPIVTKTGQNKYSISRDCASRMSALESRFPPPNNEDAPLWELPCNTRILPPNMTPPENNKLLYKSSILPVNTGLEAHAVTTTTPPVKRKVTAEAETRPRSTTPVAAPAAALKRYHSESVIGADDRSTLRQEDSIIMSQINDSSQSYQPTIYFSKKPSSVRGMDIYLGSSPSREACNRLQIDDMSYIETHAIVRRGEEGKKISSPTAQRKSDQPRKKETGSSTLGRNINKSKDGGHVSTNSNGAVASNKKSSGVSSNNKKKPAPKIVPSDSASTCDVESLASINPLDDIIIPNKTSHIHSINTLDCKIEVGQTRKENEVVVKHLHKTEPSNKPHIEPSINDRKDFSPNALRRKHAEMQKGRSTPLPSLSPRPGSSMGNNMKETEDSEDNMGASEATTDVSSKNVALSSSDPSMPISPQSNRRSFIDRLPDMKLKQCKSQGAVKDQSMSSVEKTRPGTVRKSDLRSSKSPTMHDRKSSSVVYVEEFSPRDDTIVSASWPASTHAISDRLETTTIESFVPTTLTQGLNTKEKRAAYYLMSSPANAPDKQLHTIGEGMKFSVFGEPHNQSPISSCAPKQYNRKQEMLTKPSNSNCFPSMNQDTGRSPNLSESRQKESYCYPTPSLLECWEESNERNKCSTLLSTKPSTNMEHGGLLSKSKESSGDNLFTINPCSYVSQALSLVGNIGNNHHHQQQQQVNKKSIKDHHMAYESTTLNSPPDFPSRNMKSIEYPCARNEQVVKKWEVSQQFNANSDSDDDDFQDAKSTSLAVVVPGKSRYTGHINYSSPINDNKVFNSPTNSSSCSSESDYKTLDTISDIADGNNDVEMKTQSKTVTFGTSPKRSIKTPPPMTVHNTNIDSPQECMFEKETDAESAESADAGSTITYTTCDHVTCMFTLPDISDAQIDRDDRDSSQARIKYSSRQSKIHDYDEQQIGSQNNRSTSRALRYTEDGIPIHPQRGNREKSTTTSKTKDSRSTNNNTITSKTKQHSPSRPLGTGDSQYTAKTPAGQSSKPCGERNKRSLSQQESSTKSVKTEYHKMTMNNHSHSPNPSKQGMSFTDFKTADDFTQSETMSWTKYEGSCYQSPVYEGKKAFSGLELESSTEWSSSAHPLWDMTRRSLEGQATKKSANNDTSERARVSSTADGTSVCPMTEAGKSRSETRYSRDTHRNSTLNEAQHQPGLTDSRNRKNRKPASVTRQTYQQPDSQSGNLSADDETLRTYSQRQSCRSDDTASFIPMHRKTPLENRQRHGRGFRSSEVDEKKEEAFSMRSVISESDFFYDVDDV